VKESTEIGITLHRKWSCLFCWC